MLTVTAFGGVCDDLTSYQRGPIGIVGPFPKSWLFVVVPCSRCHRGSQHGLPPGALNASRFAE